jgi:hypothetical protein
MIADSAGESWLHPPQNMSRARFDLDNEVELTLVIIGAERQSWLDPGAGKGEFENMNMTHIMSPPRGRDVTADTGQGIAPGTASRVRAPSLS